MVSKVALLLVAGTGLAVGALALQAHAVAPPLPPIPPALSSLSLSATTSASIRAGQTVSFQVVAKDGTGRGMAASGQVMATFTALSPSPPVQVLTLGPFTTDATGVFLGAFAFNTAGSYSVTAVSGSIVSSPVVVTVSVPPPVLAALAISAQASSVQAGGSVTFQIVAVDSAGAGLSGVQGQIGTSTGGFSTFTTGAGGIATAVVAFPTAGTVQVVAVVGGLGSNIVTITVTPVTVNPVLTSIVVAASASSVAAGGSITFTVTAKDQNGNGMTGVAGQITNGGVQVTPFTTGAGGVATVSLTFPSAGTYQIGAVSGTVSGNTVMITATVPPAPLTVQTASASSTGATATVVSNLAVSSGPLTIHFDVLSGATLVTSATAQRGWNPGEVITQVITWTGTLPAGSYTLRVYVVDDSTGATVSNVFAVPFSV